MNRWIGFTADEQKVLFEALRMFLSKQLDARTAAERSALYTLSEDEDIFGVKITGKLFDELANTETVL